MIKARVVLDRRIQKIEYSISTVTVTLGRRFQDKKLIQATYIGRGMNQIEVRRSGQELKEPT